MFNEVIEHAVRVGRYEQMIIDFDRDVQKFKTMQMQSRICSRLRENWNREKQICDAEAINLISKLEG